jgi:hypothetical protein
LEQGAAAAAAVAVAAVAAVAAGGGTDALAGLVDVIPPHLG